MSRHVFDRRLDMQRIKNNIKAKNEERRQQHEQSTYLPDVHVEKISSGHPVDAIPPKLTTKISVRSLRSLRTFNSHNILPDEVHNGSSGNGTFAPQAPSESCADEHSRTAPRATSHPFTLSRQDFDLAPPAPRASLTTIDGLSERLFSDEHLQVILNDSSLFPKLTAFLNQYKPRTLSVLTHYLETQKAIKAIEYANAIANNIHPLSADASSTIPCSAALLDARFEARSGRAFESLMNDALPAFVTHSLVHTVSDSVAKEITGTSIPMIRDLVGNLAEVFCLTDPSIHDNPIVFASEEFYRTTGYGRDFVIGRNCRFLQGPRTDPKCVARISAALQAGQETCETILNYRRDGSPFLNLLLCAPLYDNRGKARYFIGAQVDVTRLVEDGRGIGSFERYLAEARQHEEQRHTFNGGNAVGSGSIKPAKCLGELGRLLSSEDLSTIQSSRENSTRDDASIKSDSVHNVNSNRDLNSRAHRRILDDGQGHTGEENEAKLYPSMRSGRLPGVYQNYLLVRPAPSLRIIFVSPSLRIPGLLQSHLFSRISGPSFVRDGLADAFANCVPVTAKVHWLSKPIQTYNGHSNEGGKDNDDVISLDGASTIYNGGGSNGSMEKKTRWISCTPLTGSDDKVGVWMVVMVGSESDRLDMPSSPKAARSLTRDSERRIDEPTSPITPKQRKERFARSSIGTIHARNGVASRTGFGFDGMGSVENLRDQFTEREQYRQHSIDTSVERDGYQGEEEIRFGEEEVRFGEEMGMNTSAERERW